MKTFAAEFSFGSEKTRAWSRWERSDAIVYSMYLHGYTWIDPEYTPNALLNNLLRQNGLKGKFEITTWKKVSSGVQCVFEPHDDLIGAWLVHHLLEPLHPSVGGPPASFCLTCQTHPWNADHCGNLWTGCGH